MAQGLDSAVDDGGGSGFPGLIFGGSAVVLVVPVPTGYTARGTMVPGRAHELVPSIIVMDTPVVAQSQMVVVGASGAPLGGRKGKHCTSSLCAVSVIVGHSGQLVAVFGGSACVDSRARVALASAASIVVVMNVTSSAVEVNVVPFESLSTSKALA